MPPSKVARPPSGPLWVDEIKHDGHRLMVRRDGPRVRTFTRNGHDWADRFPAIVDAALRIKTSSFLIDGEVVIARDDGTRDFHALRSRRRKISTLEDAADAVLGMWLAFAETPALRVLLGGALVMGAVIADIIGDSREQKPAG